MQKKCSSLFLVTCAITNSIFAQISDIAGNKSFPDQPKLISAYESSDTVSGSGPVLLNNINIRAVRDFMKSCKNSTNVIWTILHGGFRVHFYSDAIQTRIFYDKQGNRESIIRYYHEDKLPFAVRHLIKSHYYDFSIFNVTEVSKGDKILYLVKIEDKILWKTIKVADGEIEVVEEYLKAE